jgi:probable addiction module antidote protein
MTNKKHKNSIGLNDFILRQLDDKAMIKEFLNAGLMTYIEDGNFDEFLHSLQIVIKARQSIKSFSEETNLNRANLYDMFKGKKSPQFKTILKILAKLGYTLKVA